MPSIKGFVNKIKEGSEKLKAKELDRKAKKHGFSSGKSYEFYSKTAKEEGKAKAESQLRKKELDRIKQEAKQDRLQGTGGKAFKIIKGIQQGGKIYNEALGELRSLNPQTQNFGSNQSYSSGYPKQRTRKPKPKPKKKKQRAKQKPRSFEEMFY